MLQSAARALVVVTKYINTIFVVAPELSVPSELKVNPEVLCYIRDGSVCTSVSCVDESVCACVCMYTWLPQIKLEWLSEINENVV